MENINYFTLLYINKDESSLGNGVHGTYLEKISKYVKCCRALNDSLVLHGQEKLTVITNDIELIKKIDSTLNCKTINFKTKVDPKIPFASAHCKLDVFNYFSTCNKNEYNVLLDSDVLCIQPKAEIFDRVCKGGLPLIYNIADQQFPAFTAEKVCKDKELLIRKSFNVKDFVSSGMWAGGEFICGNADFFKALNSACKKILPVYLENHKKLFHNGDEMIVSCALEYLIQTKKIFAFDAGTSCVIGRYYDSGTGHVQHIWKYFKQNMFVHLLMDKELLCSNNLNFENHEKFILSLEKGLYKNNTFIDATVRADCMLQKLTKLYYKVRALVKKLCGKGNAPVEY